jgi:hypothetical protein
MNDEMKSKVGASKIRAMATLIVWMLFAISWKLPAAGLHVLKIAAETPEIGISTLDIKIRIGISILLVCCCGISAIYCTFMYWTRRVPKPAASP